MAKKRLNTKLLIILAGTVAVLAVGLVVATNWYRENAGRAIARAEEYEAEGEYGLAAGQWEKAYRADGDPQYRLRGIEAISYTTSESEGGEEAVRTMFSALNELVASNPTDVTSIRALLRLQARASGLGGGGTGPSVEEVRRLARLVLAQQPGDAEARLYDAAATLALSGVASQQIPADEVDAARTTLKEIVVASPLDGTGITALLSDLQRRFGTADNEATDLLAFVLEMRGLLDAAADAAGSMQPRDDSPTDVAAVRTVLSRGYSVLSLWTAQLVRSPEVREQLGGDEPARALPGELRELALAQSDAAVAALDVERDKFADDFLETHLHRASLLVDRRDLAGAEEVYRTLTDLRPWDPRVAKAHGDFLVDQNRPADAAAVLRAMYATLNTPLPTIKGLAGATARRSRALAGQYLADAVLSEREAVSGAERRASLLDEARQALAASAAARRAANIPEQRDAQRIQGQLQIAGGEPYEGLRTLVAALRSTGDATAGDRGRGRARLLRLLADTNRQLSQPGPELEYLEQLYTSARAYMRLSDYLRLAEQYAANGRTEEARQITTFLAAAAPDNVRVQALQSRLAPPADATAAFEAMPEETEQDVRRKLQLAANTGRLDDTRRLGERLLEMAPDDEGAAISIATLLVRMNDADAARAVLERHPDSDQARLLLEQLDRAASGEAPTFAAEDDPIRRLQLEAQYALSRGDQEQAIAKLQQAAERRSDDADILDPLFRALLDTGRVEEARPLLATLTEAGLDGVGGETYRIQLLLAENETQAAVQAAEALYNRYELALPAVRLYGEALVASARAGGGAAVAGQAVDIYERALRISPRDERALAGIIGALDLAGRAQEAKAYIDRGLQANPRNATLLRAAISYELRYGDPTRILDARRDAVEATPDDPAVRQALVDTLGLAARGAGAQGDTDRAAELAREAVDAAAAALEQFPRETALLRSLAGVAPLAGEAAIERAKSIVEARMTPSAPDSLIADAPAVAAAATLLASTGDVPAAETVVRRHLAATPDAPQRQRSLMLSSLAQLLEGQGQTQAALEALEADRAQPAVRAQRLRLLATAAARRDPAVPDALNRMRDEVAAAESGEAPLSAGMLTTVAAAELDAGDPARAEDLARRAAEREPGRSDTLYILGVVALRQPEAERDLAAAQRQLEAAVEANPANVEAWRTLAEARLFQGDSAGAEAALVRLLDVRPADVRARLGVIRLALTRVPADYTVAERQFRAAEASGVGNDPQILIARAQMAQQRRNLDEAVRLAADAAQAAARAVAGTPDAEADNATAPPAYVQALAQLQIEVGRQRDAIALLDRVIANDGGAATWWARNTRASALASAGRDDEARAGFAEAYAAAQEAAPAAVEAVLAAAQDGVDYAFAYGLIAAEVEAAEPDPRTLLTVSRLAVREGDTTAAADLVERARQRSEALGELDENARLGYELQLGTVELQMDPPRLEQAMERFRGVLAQRPTNEGAANNLAYAITLYVIGGGPANDDEAVNLLREANRFGEIAYASAESRARQAGGPVNVNVADSAAWASTLLAIRTNNIAGIEEGLRRLEAIRNRALETDEIFPELYYHIARGHEALDNIVAARTALQSGYDLLDKRASEPGAGRSTDGQTRARLDALAAELSGEAGS